MFGLGNKFHDELLDVLDEPAFFFGRDMLFKSANVAGNDLIKSIRFDTGQDRSDYTNFCHRLRLSAENYESDEDLCLQGKTYRLSPKAIEGGRLLRLTPRYADEHLLRLSRSMDIVPWGLVTIEQDSGKVNFANPAAGNILQIIPSNMVGVKLLDILRVFGVERDISEHMRGTDKSYFDYEAISDLRKSWYRIHFLPYNTRDTGFCLIVLEDRTDTIIRESQYTQAQRLEALGQLAGGVAHDFNNILSIIDGYARIAKKTVEPEGQAFSYMEHIMRAVQRGSALTSQLLTFGRHKVNKERVIDLGEFVRQQEPLLYPLMDASISLSIKTEPGVFVDVAPDAIGQILMNLCINSRDAMKNGGQLFIECRKTQDRALLQIIDTGCGMSAEVQAKMFDPFFTTKDQGKGTGLGLSMVYGMVKDMDGDIQISSTVGKGTVVQIRLPLSLHKPAPHEMTEHADGSIHLNGFTALIAEDEPDLLDLVSGMMEEMGATVIKACNGNEALLLQDEYDGDIDFLLTDVVMPELNGVRLAELFEECRPGSTVMFMSGYPANGQMARVELPDGALLMPKPVDFEKLQAIVRSVVNGQNDNLKERWQVMTGQWRSV